MVITNKSRKDYTMRYLDNSQLLLFEAWLHDQCAFCYELMDQADNDMNEEAHKYWFAQLQAYERVLAKLREFNK